MYFPPVVVTIPASDAEELKSMIESTFGMNYKHSVQPANENVSVYLEFGDVNKTDETERMLECIRSEGCHIGKFVLHAQVF